MTGKEIALNIKNRMAELEIKQGELSKKLDISEQGLSVLLMRLRRNKGCNYLILEKIAKELNIKINIG